jgi:glycosyltransferase involved in cell wall biosynthesis
MRFGPRRLGLNDPGRDDGTAGSGFRMLLLPPVRWAASTHEVRSDDTPRFEALFDRMASHAIRMDLLNPMSRPWNPFANHNGLLQGVDPLRALYVLLFCRHYDAVLTISESPAVVLTLLRRLFLFRPSIIATDVAFTPGWRTRDALLHIVLPRLDGLVTLDDSHAVFARQRWRCRAWMETVRLHVDTEFFQPADFAKNGPILVVGDDFGRDYDTLLQAVEDLDIALVARTSRMPPRATSDARFRIIGKRVPWRELRSLYQAARFVVVPLTSNIHASGVSSLLEAMAMGKAVIVSASPGIGDYIVADVTALTVPPGDAGALRDAIERLRSDDQLCQRLGSAARDFAAQHCGYAPAARRFAEVVRAHSKK